MKKKLFLGVLAISFSSFANQSEMKGLEKAEFAGGCTITVCKTSYSGGVSYKTYNVKLQNGMTCQEAEDWLNKKLTQDMRYPTQPTYDLYRSVEVNVVTNTITLQDIVLATTKSL